MRRRRKKKSYKHLCGNVILSQSLCSSGVNVVYGCEREVFVIRGKKVVMFARGAVQQKKGGEGYEAVEAPCTNAAGKEKTCNGPQNQ